MKRVSRKRRGTLKTAAFSLWIAIVGIFALWQSVSYRGVMAVLAEWQFDVLGLYYPTLTFVLVAGLLVLPGYFIFMRPRRRDAKERIEAHTLRSARAFLAELLGIAGGLVIIALVLLIAMAMQPSMDGTMQRITLDRPIVALPREGPTELTGIVGYDRVAALDTDQIVAGRNARFAPITQGGSQDRDLQFFVEIPSVTDLTRRGTTSMTGVLVRNDLPGELVRLYRYAGYRVEKPFFVLYSGTAPLRRPYIVVVVQLAIAALIALVFAGLQWRRVKRLRDTPPVAETGLIAA